MVSLNDIGKIVFEKRSVSAYSRGLNIKLYKLLSIDDDGFCIVCLVITDDGNNFTARPQYIGYDCKELVVWGEGRIWKGATKLRKSQDNGTTG